MPRVYTRLTDEEKFWRHVQKTDDDSCWAWKAGKYLNGYGLFWSTTIGRLTGAHRVAWTLTNGPIPDGLFVLHHCDNRGCVRPDHLFLGTHTQNMADMRAKGRQSHPQGEQQPHSVLTNQSVTAIFVLRERGVRVPIIAEAFHTSEPNIYNILTGKRWGHFSKARGDAVVEP